ncbi:MAG: chemotaxis protein CheW [Gemmatimonadaceae bacterium]
MTDLLIFELAGVRGGLPVASVREIVRAVQISPLPGAPSVIEGVINVRGSVIPVVSLRARLGLPPSTLDASEHMIVMSALQRDVALRVDRALTLAPVADEDISSPDALTGAAWNVAGVARLADGLLVIHDPNAFLSQAEDVALASALRSDARVTRVGEHVG